MIADAVQDAVELLRTQGDAISVRNVNRQLRRTAPRYMGRSFRDLLPLLKFARLPADARQALQRLDACSAQVAPLLASGASGRDQLMVAGETAKALVLDAQQREAAAGRSVAVFETALERWSAASSRLIWGTQGRPW